MAGIYLTGLSRYATELLQEKNSLTIKLECLDKATKKITRAIANVQHFDPSDPPYYKVQWFPKNDVPEKIKIAVDEYNKKVPKEVVEKLKEAAYSYASFCPNDGVYFPFGFTSAPIASMVESISESISSQVQDVIFSAYREISSAIDEYRVTLIGYTQAVNKLKRETKKEIKCIDDLYNNANERIIIASRRGEDNWLHKFVDEEWTKC